MTSTVPWSTVRFRMTTLPNHEKLCLPGDPVLPIILMYSLHLGSMLLATHRCPLALEFSPSSPQHFLCDWIQLTAGFSLLTEWGLFEMHESFFTHGLFQCCIENYSAILYQILSNPVMKCTQDQKLSLRTEKKS